MSTGSTATIPEQLVDRPLLDHDTAAELSGLFDVMSNDTRLRMLHSIARAGECSVNDIAEQVGASTQSVSNHLQRMSATRIVDSRRDGNRIYYRIVDPCVGGLMELGLCLLGHPPGD